MGYCSLINNNLYCVFYVLIKSDENLKKKKNYWNNIEMWSRSLCKIFIISWSTKSWVNVCMGEIVYKVQIVLVICHM